MDEFWTGSRDPVKITAIHQRMRGGLTLRLTLFDTTTIFRDGSCVSLHNSAARVTHFQVFRISYIQILFTLIF